MTVKVKATSSEEADVFHNADGVTVTNEPEDHPVLFINVVDGNEKLRSYVHENVEWFEGW